jgi:hypothetical protein
MIKITGKHAVIYFDINVKVGELEVTRQYHVWVGSAPGKYDLDFIDTLSIKYMGIAIEGWQNWKKFKEFHLEMGIDFEKAIDEEVMHLLAKEPLEELVKKEMNPFTIL